MQHGFYSIRLAHHMENGLVVSSAATTLNRRSASHRVMKPSYFDNTSHLLAHLPHDPQTSRWLQRALSQFKSYEPQFIYRQSAMYWQNVAIQLSEALSIYGAFSDWQQHYIGRLTADAYDDVPDVTSVEFWQQYSLEWQTNYERISGLLSVAGDFVKSRLPQAITGMQENRDELKTIREQRGELPYALELVLFAADLFASYSQHHFNDLAAEMEEWQNKEPIIADQATKILAIVKAQEKWFRHQFVGALLFTASLEEEDPRVICWEIIKECESKGEPSLATLDRLGLAWVKEHLPDAPQSLKKLRSGLKWNQAERNSGKSREEFSADSQAEPGAKGISPPSLRKYASWRKAIEEIVEWWLD